MKIIVVDIDRLKIPLKYRKTINASKICTLTKKDFGKKTLLNLRKNDPKYLVANRRYNDAIFKLRDDDGALKHENKMFRQIQDRIKWFRIGVILRREKAVKILLKLLRR